MAAVLACGPDALLSHRSAALLLDLLQMTETRIDVSVLDNRRTRRGLRIHRNGRLDEEDRMVSSGIPVTSVARTLLDLAGVVRPRMLERAVDQAERLQVFDLRAVERVRERNPRRRGLAALDQVLTHYAGPTPPPSELERIFLDLCRRAQLPSPAANCFIAGSEVDIAWLDRRVVVELDGYEYHRTRQAFERDRVRDSSLQIAGYRVLRVTYRRLMREPEQVIVELRSLLDP
jgi:hypothetical protein